MHDFIPSLRLCEEMERFILYMKLLYCRPPLLPLGMFLRNDVCHLQCLNVDVIGHDLGTSDTAELIHSIGRSSRLDHFVLGSHGDRDFLVVAVLVNAFRENPQSTSSRPFPINGSRPRTTMKKAGLLTSS